MSIEITIDDDMEAIDFERVSEWLAASYWSPGIERRTVERGARNSTVVLGAYSEGIQVAYARAISDTTRFAYICDVIVDERFRGRGLGRRLTRALLDHERLREVEHWYLITRDAQAVYRPLGFAEYCRPDRTVMSWSRPR